jgi:hypothetical protein
MLQVDPNTRVDRQKKVIEIHYSPLGKYVHYKSSDGEFAALYSLSVSDEMFSKLIKQVYNKVEYPVLNKFLTKYLLL